MKIQKSLKKALLAIVLGMLVFNAVAFALEPANLFTDVKVDDQYSDAIKYLKDQGVVQGYSDGTYAPGNTITRAEFLKILIEVSGYEPEGENCFKDVKTQWFAPYVCKAASLGFVEGYDGEYFDPARDINLAEASKMIAEVLNIETDDTKSDVWYHKYISALGNKGAIPSEISSFDQKISRGEMAEMIWRLKENVTYKDSVGYLDLKDGVQLAGIGGDLKRFASCGDLKEYIDENTVSRNGGMMIMEDAAMAPTVGATQNSSKSSGAASDYSTTNIQVAGVDEADIVKNDGEYIYFVKSNTIRIVKVYPPTNMKEVSKITFTDGQFYPRELYLDGNKLMVVGDGYDDRVFEGLVKTLPPEYYDYGGAKTKLYIYDLTDKSNPEIERKVVFDGSYLSSRKVDDMVYIVANKYLYQYYPVPLYSDSGTNKSEALAGCADVGYFPGENSANYLIVAGVPTDNSDGEIVKQVVLGSSENIYASKENLYVVEQLNNYNYGWVYDEPTSSDEKSAVYKFGLGKTAIDYEGKGEVPGHILNQFSMDENDGYFRIATTLGEVWDETEKSKNNLYVLDDDLEVVGKIEDIAPGEKIYSVRFMGDRAYMVTFKKVDPLFVIDTSSPTNPKILGKLKIPGYSDYLHPYDENHIIGFGKDAIDASELEVSQRNLDFAWYQGIKIAMFDVTDPGNPVELHKVVIGDRGTDSPLLYDHKALLFDKEKGFMAFPVTVAEVSQNLKDDPNTPDNTYGDPVFQGAYIYDIGIDDGFKLRGTISQYPENEIREKAGGYWYGDKDIQRIIYIGDYFYTVSNGEVMATGMSDMKEKGNVEMEGDDYLSGGML